MSNFLELAKNRPSARRLLESLSPRDFQSAKRLDNVLQYTNDNSLPNLTNGGSVDFQIRQNSFNIDGMNLQVAITNAHAANTGQWNPFLAINYIEIYSNNGQNLIDRRYGQDLLLDMISLSAPEFASVRLACGLDADYTSTAGAIAANTTSTFNIPFYGLFWNNATVNLGYSGDLLVRIFWLPASSWLQGAVAAASLTFSAMAVILDADILTNNDAAVIRKSIQANGFKNLVLSAQYSANTLSLNTSSTYTMTLGGITGLVSHLFIVVNEASPTAAQMETPNAIASFNMLDSVGNSIQGGFAKTSNFNRYVEAPNHFKDESLTASQAIYLSTFASKPAKSYTSPAKITGFFVADNDLQLQITTTSTITPGTYTVKVFARVFNSLSSKGGNLVLINS